MAGEGAGRWSVGVILAGDMDLIWRLGLTGWDGRWSSGVVMILGLAGDNIQILLLQLHQNKRSFYTEGSLQ